MADRKERDWAELAMDGWMLGAEMSMVMWLRSLRMMAGGRPALTEMQRMMTEKMAANATLWPAVMAGGLAQTPEGVAARSLAHYRKPIRANRRRLSGGR
jgi:hypothetical protein